MSNLKWSMTQTWNESLEQYEERPLSPRNHIWASELGGSFLDRFLKMKAVVGTNPPNARSLRKFEAGRFFEWIAGRVLNRAGILRESQTWVSYQYPDLLKVTGKTDFIAGGKIDWDKSLQTVHRMQLPEFFGKATDNIIKFFKEKYPEGLADVVIEIKSASNFMMERYEKCGANPNHKLQLFHYLKALNFEEGHICYICKDDLRMLEVGVMNPSGIEDYYKKDIETMTEVSNKGEEPPKEPEIVFEYGRFSTNWKVEYSNYLTKLYGYKTPDEYREAHKKKIAQWNRTVSRVAKGSKMTDLNLKTLEEIKKEFDLDVITKNILVEEEENDDGTTPEAINGKV